MKKIGGCIYTHCSNYDNLTENIKNMVAIATAIMFNAGMMLEWLGSVIYKVDAKNKKVKFIESKDFNTAREPQVGNSYPVDLDAEKIKLTKAKGQIYHHKWMVVDESYKGFDIEESKRWSEKWQSVIPKDRKIKSRIGYKKYWDEYLKEYGLEVR